MALEMNGNAQTGLSAAAPDAFEKAWSSGALWEPCLLEKDCKFFVARVVLRHLLGKVFF